MSEPMKNEKPWWWPQLTNDEWRARIRNDYPEETSRLDNEQLAEHYARGYRYADVWDHLGDARSAYEKLADAFLKLVSELGKKPEDFK